MLQSCGTVALAMCHTEHWSALCVATWLLALTPHHQLSEMLADMCATTVCWDVCHVHHLMTRVIIPVSHWSCCTWMCVAPCLCTLQEIFLAVMLHRRFKSRHRLTRRRACFPRLLRGPEHALAPWSHPCAAGGGKLLLKRVHLQGTALHLIDCVPGLLCACSSL